MPQLTVEGYGTFEVPEGKRLVKAIEENGVDILHRCGGYARCTTCRVTFQEGEPTTITQAEHDKLEQNNLVGQARLSCQILCNHDMVLTPLMTLANSGLPDPGSEPVDEITPEPVYIS